MVDLVFLGINDIGQRVYDWLVARDDAEVLALLTEPEQLAAVERLDPSLVVSAGFRHLVPADVLEIPEIGTVNFHKAYLPFNRGANPNVWSILGEAPAGVTLHYMNPEMDEGPIIDRRQVPVRPDDTGLTLYERLEREQFEQFTDCWPAIRDDTVDSTHQEPTSGTSHHKQDFVDLWPIDRDEEVRTGDLLDRLRALTFPPFKNAYFEVDGDRYFVEVEITEETEIEEQPDRKIPVYSDGDIP